VSSSLAVHTVGEEAPPLDETGQSVETIELLVTVKAYPALSAKYGEAECIAGVQVDAPQPQWVRLFPIPFRDLPFSQRFRKYQMIRLEVEPHGTDTRPESYRPNVESLTCGERLDTQKTDKKWERRRAYVEPLEVESMCELARRQRIDGTSLGLFRPSVVEDLTVEPDSGDWDPAKKVIADQPSLLFPGKKGLEKIPYRFRYRYRCSDAQCKGHHQSIVDWELAQAFRSWDYPEEERLLKIKERWLEKMFGPDRDTRLFVGNQLQHPEAFLVLGVFWPPKL
jgi:hypothetical protein